MRSCPVCGLDVEDSYLYCPDDGSRLVEAQVANSSITSDLPAAAHAEAQAANSSITTGLSAYAHAEAQAANSSITTGLSAYAHAEAQAANSSITTELPAAAHAKVVQAGKAHRDVVVLYCGECAAEYPMTFVECPVHHVVLTRYEIQPTPPVPAPPAPDAVDDEPTRGEHSDHIDERHVASGASLEVQLPVIPEPLAAAAREERWGASPIRAATGGPKRESRSWAPSILGVDHRTEDYAPYEPDSESRPENPSYRIVAATLVVALVMFCVVAVYIFFSGSARKQAVTRAPQPIQTTTAEEPPPLIPTPVEALDYKPEPTFALASPAAPDSAPPERKQKYADAKTAFLASTAKAPTAVRPGPASMDRPFDPPPRPAMTPASIIRETTPARVEHASVDARLIRLRSMRTPSGVRYDLTFDLQDESGRHAQWERMQISTRSASGVNQSQAIPFVHRLGASGALTFTVSVELRGRSEADWQGRVICTTTGSDNDGKPLRASFGTNVRP